MDKDGTKVEIRSNDVVTSLYKEEYLVAAIMQRLSNGAYSYLLIPRLHLQEPSKVLHEGSFATFSRTGAVCSKEEEKLLSNRLERWVEKENSKFEKKKPAKRAAAIAAQPAKPPPKRKAARQPSVVRSTPKRQSPRRAQSKKSRRRSPSSESSVDQESIEEEEESEESSDESTEEESVVNVKKRKASALEPILCDLLVEEARHRKQDAEEAERHAKKLRMLIRR